MATLDTELRKLRPAELFGFAKEISFPDSWKKLMDIIPQPGGEEGSHLFTSKHIAMIENAADKHRSAAEIFIDEWGTWGKNRPTLGFVIDLLVKAELFRAADYLAVTVLKGSPPPRPTAGPAAPISIPDLENLQIPTNEPAQPVRITNFDDRSTLDIDIKNVTYSSDDFSEFSVCSPVDQDNSSENREKFIDIRFSEPRNTENQAQGDQVEKSDLIKFSKTVELDEVKRVSKNLIEFSASIRNTQSEDIQNQKVSEILLPNFQTLALENKEILANVSTRVQSPQELESSELPCCINNDTSSEIANESSNFSSSSTTFPSKSATMSDESIMQTEDSEGNGLPRILARFNKKLKVGDLPRNEMLLDPLKTEDLPKPVVEFLNNN